MKDWMSAHKMSLSTAVSIWGQEKFAGLLGLNDNHFIKSYKMLGNATLTILTFDQMYNVEYVSVTLHLKRRCSRCKTKR